MRLGTAIIRNLHVSRKALICATSHGQVKLNGATMTIADLNTPVEDIQGSYVEMMKREFRVGSRLLETHEQLKL